METNSEASRTSPEETKLSAPEQTSPSIEEPKSASPEQPAVPAEEPIVLNKLFPTADKDLDSLFPDPEMKKLLKDLVRTRQKNERFLKKVDVDELPPDED
jgi:hypothetical protein